MWSTLAPLIIVSAVLLAQIIVTLLLLHSSLGGAFAWVVGMTTARLVQGILSGSILSAGGLRAEVGSPGFVAAFQLMFAVLLFVMALRKAFAGEDEDAPPPKWMAMAQSMSRLAAILAGAGYVSFTKIAILTLGATTAIADAHLGAKVSILTFILFAVLAQSGQFTILALATSSACLSTAVLDQADAWLRRYNRLITVVVCVVFGTWFLVKALG